MLDTEKVCAYIRSRDFDAAAVHVKAALDENLYYDELMFAVLLNIAILEQENGEKTCIFDVGECREDWFRHFHRMKFLIRRLEVPHFKNDTVELFAYRDEHHVSDVAIRMIMEYSTLDPEKVMALYRDADIRNGGSHE